MTSFRNSSSYLLTSESVTEGHPDKVCDQVSDAILDAILDQDRIARVACETAVTKGFLAVIGEVTTSAEVPIEKKIRDTLKGIGYVGEETGFDPDHALISVYLKEQSQNIAAGVDHSLEERTGGADPFELQGAGDQGMMIGFACGETPELMPLTISLAQRLTRRLAAVRKSGELAWLLPDGKSQVTVEYEYGYPKRIEAVVISTHHRRGVSNRDIEEGVRSLVIDAVLPAWLVDAETKIMVNPSGRFEIGGPDADAGLTGRKIIVDTYGGVARHGGGAFSGKDPSKVDRSAAYAARHVAKNLVSAGIAERCEVQVSYAIGRAQPTSIAVETFGTGTLPEAEILGLVRSNFDLRPAAIIERLDLRQPIYARTASYGHFGRDDLDLPWERTDQAAALREAVPATAVRS
ncbi:methionine adenosyltransferase [Candidatus Nephthysia bennettiae]|uniref:S-adenosylmethionine synthase n=1 Tax=Candidatus Nephthysia bennettiae TaxID=3127016 RepID=A0A934K0B2_9BACT|nr:methionine adenosyltransferase [Candidatus Dormibacteraeota bacterium]MBJ7610825.1 methionine adenosyltransferase [Candidatus Dormibacteraeota bacterium]